MRKRYAFRRYGFRILTSALLSAVLLAPAARAVDGVEEEPVATAVSPGPLGWVGELLEWVTQLLSGEDPAGGGETATETQTTTDGSGSSGIDGERGPHIDPNGAV